MAPHFSVYVHTPFCASRCPYCDFFSTEGAEAYIDDYFDSVVAEIGAFARSFETRPVDTVYFGGGTPSYVPSGAIERVMGAIQAAFELSEGYEASIEANPDSLTRQKCEAYLAMGFNRISIGVQSFSAGLLAAIGRRHGPDAAISAVEASKEAGFRNFNCDVMFGLPGQSLAAFEDSVATALSLGAPHISAYSLTVEEGHPFHGCCPEGLERDMQHAAVRMLARAGLGRYEISNFALPGYECRHNLYTWQMQEYAGFGAGAHSFLECRRYANPSDLLGYISKIRKSAHALDVLEVLGEREMREEWLMLAMRTSAGVRYAEYKEAFGEDFMDCYGRAAEKLQADGLICIGPDAAILTQAGYDFNNAVALAFMD